MRKALFLLAIAVLAISTFAQDTTQGTLYAKNKGGDMLGACPLKNTAVTADISGFLARVHVRQEFENTFGNAIEAVYSFPLSQNGAVDKMTMTIGTRVVRGKIMKRGEARKVYEAAKASGRSASLLDQERPNIFTQSVANIMPGEKVVVEISYVESLRYEDGAYEFVFPMTVGPRYVPNSVVDASRIKPPVATARNGGDISIVVNLNAGVPVEELRSPTHAIDQISDSPNKAKITLKGEKTIANKDFILRYDVSGKRIEDAVLAHRDEHGGFVSLILQPPDKFTSEDMTPKEIVFVLDTSGSMDGFPIEKAKEAIKLSLEGLYPNDTFNLITFAGDTSILFEQPVPATQANLERALVFLDSRSGSGGTEMMKAIKAALEPTDSQEHLRIVCFLTDAFVGNENEIIAEIQKHPRARVFSFGIGSSVNRFLLDKMAEAGNGEVEYVGPNDDGSKAARRFYERVRSPLLTDLSIDWNGMPVEDVYPRKLSDLFSAKPVIVNARYTKGASGTIKLKGKIAGQPYERVIAINLPEIEAENDVLATLWARRRVDELSNDLLKAADNAARAAFEKQIESIGLEFRILTSLTSFVAVEDQVVNRNGSPTTIEVPVLAPGWGDPAGFQIDGASAASGSGGGGGGGAVVATSVTTQQLATLPKATGVANMSVAEEVTVTGGSTSVDTSTSSSTTVFTQSPMGGLTSGSPSISSLKTSGSGSGSGRGSGSGLTASNEDQDSSSPVDTPFRKLEIIAGLQRPPSVAGTKIGKPDVLVKPEVAANSESGTVSVYITIDEKGSVAAAEAVSGKEQLRDTSVAAARLSKFTPSLISGKPVKAICLVKYRFAAGIVSVSAGNLAVQTKGSEAPTAETIMQWAMKEKLHPWIYAFIERSKRDKSAAGSNEAQFVADGKASVRIVLTEVSEEAKVAMKAAGLEVESNSNGLSYRGLAEAGKLIELSKIDAVKFILPLMRK